MHLEIHNELKNSLDTTVPVASRSKLVEESERAEERKEKRKQKDWEEFVFTGLLGRTLAVSSECSLYICY